MLHDNLSISENGHLRFAGLDTVDLAGKYGTPLYLMDEDKIRENCRIYKNAFKKHFGYCDTIIYASKANSFKQLYRIMREEGMGIDVVSSGEIFTAKEAGFDLSRAFFHSNNKTGADISYAMDSGVGFFVADNAEEIIAIQAEAEKRRVVQDVLIRLTPGIDPHTYEKISTGKIDSKFGSSIDTGDADSVLSLALSQPNVRVRGFHCHVGSQVFGEDVHGEAALKMLGYAAKVRKQFDFSMEILNLGGGFGARYLENDPEVDIDGRIESIAKTVKTAAEALEIEIPKIYMEPGRSIVANAGITLYTVGSVKRITGYKNYVSVDGGMADAPRHALYGAKYTSIVANKALVPPWCETSDNRDEFAKNQTDTKRVQDGCEISANRLGAEGSESQNPCRYAGSGEIVSDRPADDVKAEPLLADLVGRCCESGDILQRDALFPSDIRRGDIVALLTTGAYHYSMSSNYNRLPRPATVMVRRGVDGRSESYVAVRGETLDDLCRNDV